MSFLHADDDTIDQLAKMSAQDASGSVHHGGNHNGHNMHGNPLDVHSGHSSSDSAGGHMMAMYFHLGYQETVLFSFWTINSVGGLVGSMIGIFLAAMLYEGLKVFREYLLQKALVCETATGGSSSASRTTGSNSNNNGLRVPLTTTTTNGNVESPDGSVLVATIQPVKAGFLRPHPFSAWHLIQTFLHMLQVFISYLLMLVFMTYNVWLALAVVAGAGAGYFLFGWRKKTIVDINEHCH